MLEVDPDITNYDPENPNNKVVYAGFLQETIDKLNYMNLNGTLDYLVDMLETFRFKCNPKFDKDARGHTINHVTLSEAEYGKCLYRKVDGTYGFCDSSSLSTMPCSAICISDTTGPDKEVLINGMVRYDDWYWTVGARLYVGQDGFLTENAPTIQDSVVQCVAIAYERNIIQFNPALVEVVIA